MVRGMKTTQQAWHAYLRCNYLAKNATGGKNAGKIHLIKKHTISAPCRTLEVFLMMLI